MSSHLIIPLLLLRYFDIEVKFRSKRWVRFNVVGE